MSYCPALQQGKTPNRVLCVLTSGLDLFNPIVHKSMLCAGDSGWDVNVLVTGLGYITTFDDCFGEIYSYQSTHYPTGHNCDWP